MIDYDTGSFFDPVLTTIFLLLACGLVYGVCGLIKNAIYNFQARHDV